MKDREIIYNLENLRKIRESKNITQLKLSNDLNVSQELISRYEVGTSFPQPNMLIKLSKYFNCSVDYLLGLTDITTPIKYLVKENNVKYAEFLKKYESLNDDNKKHFNEYLEFLINKNQ